jgi:hypothetical protein
MVMVDFKLYGTFTAPRCGPAVAANSLPNKGIFRAVLALKSIVLDDEHVPLPIVFDIAFGLRSAFLTHVSTATRNHFHSHPGWVLSCERSSMSLFLYLHGDRANTHNRFHPYYAPEVQPCFISA